MNMIGALDKEQTGGVKLPICLVLDKSGSMVEKVGGIVKIEELNKNVLDFIEIIKNDSVASRITDLAIIGVGGMSPEIISGYTSIHKLKFKPLSAWGRTPLGEAVNMALDLLEKRKAYYKSSGIENYKPIMLLMSDGEPTDQYRYAAQRMTENVLDNKIKIFPVGIGRNFNFNILREFSPKLPPKQITSADGFVELFRLLSKSASQPHDDSIDKWFMEVI